MKRLVSLLLVILMLCGFSAACAKKTADGGTDALNTAAQTEPTPGRTEAPTATPEPTVTPEPTPDPVIAEAKRIAAEHGIAEEELHGEYALFTEFSAIVENSTTLGEFKEFVYRIFPVVARNAEYLDKDNFFGRLRGLSIRMNQIDDGNLGEYTDWTTEISLNETQLTQDTYKLPHTLFHELMHFLDFTLNGGVGSCILLDGQRIRLADIGDYSEEEQARFFYCTDTDFVMEGGAELYTAKYFAGAVNAYFKPCLVMTGLEYIYGEEKLNELFFSRESDAVFAEMLLEAGYSEDEYRNAVFSLNWIAYPADHGEPAHYKAPEDLLIDLYEYKLGDGWRTDEEFLYILKCLNGVALTDYERSEHAEFLRGIVFRNWNQYAAFQNHLTADMPIAVDMLVLPPSPILLDGEYRISCYAQWEDPETGVLRRGTVIYDFDLASEKRNGFELRDMDAICAAYFGTVD